MGLLLGQLVEGGRDDDLWKDLLARLPVASVLSPAKPKLLRVRIITMLLNGGRSKLKTLPQA